MPHPLLECSSRLWNGEQGLDSDVLWEGKCEEGRSILQEARLVKKACGRVKAGAEGLRWTRGTKESHTVDPCSQYA